MIQGENHQGELKQGFKKNLIREINGPDSTEVSSFVYFTDTLF